VLSIGGECVIEFPEEIGVILDRDGLYHAYFLHDGNVTCNGLCLKQDCSFDEEPAYFLFFSALETARFIALNMLPRSNRFIHLLKRK
jgi:hypothetical protein